MCFVLVISGNVHAQQQGLTPEMQNRLAALPLKCLQQEYPNKLGQMLKDSTEILAPQKLHPAFYGCFDWHSSVHGHWSLVFLVNHFPGIEHKEEIIRKLTVNLSEDNIRAEIAYFSKKHEKSFERTYGWAWLLKLQQELEVSETPALSALAVHLKPLTNLLIERYIEFLPKLVYPLRVGTHTNTAFGLSLAYDYALHDHNEPLKQAIAENAKRFFLKDEDCPFAWSPAERISSHHVWKRCTSCSRYFQRLNSWPGPKSLRRHCSTGNSNGRLRVFQTGVMVTWFTSTD